MVFVPSTAVVRSERLLRNLSVTWPPTSRTSAARFVGRPTRVDTTGVTAAQMRGWASDEEQADRGVLAGGREADVGVEDLVVAEYGG
jgi:hypothetical protein